MAYPNPTPMTLDEFLDWESRQDEKWELVDGFPVLRRTRLMAGGTSAHARIAANLIIALGTRLRGRPCAPVGADLKFACATGNMRYPDVLIECGPADRSLLARDVRAIFEVVSDSNTRFHQMRLLADYQSVDTVEAIVFVSQTEPYAQVWLRGADRWTTQEVDGMGGGIALPAFDALIPLTEVYDGVSLGA